MLRFILKRLLLGIPTLFAVLTIIFLLMRVVPGDPAYAVLGDYATDDAVNALRKQMGLDKPIWEQYSTYMGGLLQGDLGDSLVTAQAGVDQIRTVLPYTLAAYRRGDVYSAGSGIPAGVITAVRQNTWIDYWVRVLSLTDLSAPAFYIGLLLMYLLSAKAGWFPAISTAGFDDPLANLHALILPAFTLGIGRNRVCHAHDAFGHAECACG